MPNGNVNPPINYMRANAIIQSSARVLRQAWARDCNIGDDVSFNALGFGIDVL